MTDASDYANGYRSGYLAGVTAERKRCLRIAKEDETLGRQDLGDASLAKVAGARVLAAERIARMIEDPSISFIIENSDEPQQP